MIKLRDLHHDEIDDHLDKLSSLLIHCVNDGASIGFLRPLNRRISSDYWTAIFEQVKANQRKLIIAEINNIIVGSVQLIPILIPNQLHRVEISKLIVDPEYRKRGIGSSLIRFVESEAIGLGRNLINFDTAGEVPINFYKNLGFTPCGSIPNYALDADGRLEPNMIFYKNI